MIKIILWHLVNSSKTLSYSLAFLPLGKVTKNRLVEICIVYVESLAEKHQDYIKTLPVNMGIMAWHGQTSPEQAEFMQIIIDFYIE